MIVYYSDDDRVIMNYQRYLHWVNQNFLLHTTLTLIKRMSQPLGAFEGAVQWAPCNDLLEENDRSRYGLLVLNTPINLHLDPEAILNLWNQAKVRVTVDGGTQRWVQWLTKNKYRVEIVKSPELITGDMDSLSKDVLENFSSTKTKVIETPDQNETDYVKALKELKKYCTEKLIQIDKVYILADTSGRFDQIMANINALFKKAQILGQIKVFQIASNSLTWLLDKGSHVIHIPRPLSKNQDWCALIPIGAPCVVSSTGLKWNLSSHRLEFGGLVSTSNTYDGSPVVTVQTDNPIVWSMSIEELI